MLRTLLPLLLFASPLFADPLPGTKPLMEAGDLSMKMVEGIDQWLLRATAASVEERKKNWKVDYTSPQAYEKSIQPLRQQLKKILGVVDERVKLDDIQKVGGIRTSSLVGENALFAVHRVSWAVLPGVEGEGLLLEPKTAPVAQVVAIPDADQTPEMLVGLVPGIPAESQFAKQLAENGCRVIVPLLINRGDEYSGSTQFNRFTNQTHREFVYRMAFEMGRHIIGYEIQKILAVVDWFSKEKLPIGLYGYGEGALLAFYTGAVSDTRIAATVVSGYFLPRENLWQEPIYRNVWSFLKQFGDAEIAAAFYLYDPALKPEESPIHRHLIIEHSRVPKVLGPPAERDGRKGAAPGSLRQAKLPEVRKELERAEALLKDAPKRSTLTAAPESMGTPETLKAFLQALLGKAPTLAKSVPLSSLLAKDFDPAPRQKRQFDQLVNFTLNLWRHSEVTRAARFAKADSSSPEAWEKSIQPIREFFHEELIGKLPAPVQKLNPRSRKIYDEPKWTGYEVMLDLHPDVYAYGILLLPKDMKKDEKRPVVVCQHGLEGRPTDIVNPKEKTKYYNSFGAQLADQGFIVFAPQNPYIGKDVFRQVQRKAYPLKLSLFSFIVQQHDTILNWLETLPNVDGKRMAFYGLSYGGKTAMRVPAILPKYCLSICSGDFNEWIGKMVTLQFRGSYMWTFEYEMYEFDLGTTFNYAEMAYLIAPRPFMVERGHDDGVGIDEMVAYEFAKVRYHYQNRLKLIEKTDIEFFVGGHEINGKGTFAFLRKHLNWPKDR